jgi:hypothetical protein
MFTLGFSFGMVSPLEMVAPIKGVILVANSRSGKGESAENGSNLTTLPSEGSAAEMTEAPGVPGDGDLISAGGVKSSQRIPHFVRDDPPQPGRRGRSKLRPEESGGPSCLWVTAN